MRKGATRGMVNKTFIRVSGNAKIWNRKTGNTESEHFIFYLSREKQLENTLQSSLGKDRILLEISDVTSVSETYSMDPEEFRRNATIY